MKKLLLFNLLFSSLYVNAQMYVWNNGSTTEFPINQVDSITFNNDNHDNKYKALSGEFSVSPTQKVRFAAGNLAYVLSKGEWIFMNNQYEGSPYCMKDNYTELNNSETYFGIAHDTIGVFYGSNIYNHWGLANIARYSNQFADWGKLIGEGWHTLTIDEWNYLIDTRKNASSKKTIATVNGVYGILLLPDDWSNTTISIQVNNLHYSSSNIFSLATWNCLEQEGAVFLPALLYDSYAGWLKGQGLYWLNGYTTGNTKSQYLQLSIGFSKYASNVPCAINISTASAASGGIPSNVRLVK